MKWGRPALEYPISAGSLNCSTVNTALTLTSKVGNLSYIYGSIWKLMKDLNCLIVEDEPLAAQILEDYIGQIPGLRLAGTCQDVMEANAVLQSSRIDIIFLDINLPLISGVEFIRSLSRNYHIILTTAYHQYAVEGFSLGVADYLLKPIEFSRFLKAVNKVFDREKGASPPAEVSGEDQVYHFFNTGRKQVKVFERDIHYIESLKDYVKIHTGGRPVVTKYQIGQILDLLTGTNFLRIHKSFIINLEKITAFNASEIEIGETALPIGRTYREMVDHVLSKIARQ